MIDRKGGPRGTQQKNFKIWTQRKSTAAINYWEK